MSRLTVFSAALLATNPAPAAADIASAMNSNICRCGTYPRIRAAIEEASRLMRAADTSGTTQ